LVAVAELLRAHGPRRLLVRHEFEGGYEPSVNWFLMKESQVSAHFVAKQHGGTREVATKPGAFTCLTIVLPRAQAKV
jgi:hypothetical protein